MLGRVFNLYMYFYSKIRQILMLNYRETVSNASHVQSASSQWVNSKSISVVLASEHELWLIGTNEHLKMVSVDGDKAVIQPLTPKSFPGSVSSRCINDTKFERRNHVMSTEAQRPEVPERRQNPNSANRRYSISTSSSPQSSHGKDRGFDSRTPLVKIIVASLWRRAGTD